MAPVVVDQWQSRASGRPKWGIYAGTRFEKDAVVVSTPDHTHAPAALTALLGRVTDHYADWIVSLPPSPSPPLAGVEIRRISWTRSDVKKIRAHCVNNNENWIDAFQISY